MTLRRGGVALAATLLMANNTDKLLQKNARRGKNSGVKTQYDIQLIRQPTSARAHEFNMHCIKDRARNGAVALSS